MLRERFKVPRTYLDFRELLEQPDIDAVTIATPNHLHAPMAVEALKEKSLLRSNEVAELGGEIRFGMYESIREYAAGKLEESGKLPATRERRCS